MIQLTKWMDPYQYMWSNGIKITIMEWAKEQKDIIQKKTGKETYIKISGNKIAIYRERLK